MKKEINGKVQYMNKIINKNNNGKFKKQLAIKNGIIKNRNKIINDLISENAKLQDEKRILENKIRLKRFN